MPGPALGEIAPSAALTARAWPFFTSCCLAMNSGFPPSRMSVPRPAMLVAIVTMPYAARLGHNFRFALVILGIQYNVLDALPLQNSRKYLRLFNRGGAHQHWLILARGAPKSDPLPRSIFPSPSGKRRRILNSPHHLVASGSQRFRACRSCRTPPLPFRPYPSCRKVFE